MLIPNRWCRDLVHRTLRTRRETLARGKGRRITHKREQIDEKKGQEGKNLNEL